MAPDELELVVNAGQVLFDLRDRLVFGIKVVFHGGSIGSGLVRCDELIFEFGGKGYPVIPVSIISFLCVDFVFKFEDFLL